MRTTPVDSQKVWAFTDYGLSELWVTTASTVAESQWLSSGLIGAVACGNEGIQQGSRSLKKWVDRICFETVTGWKCAKNEIWKEVESFTLEDPDFGERSQKIYRRGI
jgi:hypothetical protein